MHILHGTWIPAPKPSFVQEGEFCLWIETQKPSVQGRTQSGNHLQGSKLIDFLQQTLGLPLMSSPKPTTAIQTQYFLLPTSGDGYASADHPLPSPELARYMEQEQPEQFTLAPWEIETYPIRLIKNYNVTGNPVVRVLNDLHFIALYGLADVQLGSDLWFWYHCTQALKRTLFQEQYIPALTYREASPQGKKTQRQAIEIYGGWEWSGDRYPALIAELSARMPLICTAGFAEKPKGMQLHDRSTLLRHFAETWLNAILTNTPIPQAFAKTLDNSLIADCLTPQYKQGNAKNLEQYQQWQLWRDRLTQSHQAAGFTLTFQLEEPPKPEDPWSLKFQVAAKDDPSLRINLLDYWRLKTSQQQTLQKKFGDDFEKHLLLNLGYAARMYSEIWRGLDTDEPVGLALSLEEAFNFLKETAWVLESAGYRVIVPAWWTPQGRQRAKVRLRASGKSSSSQKSGKPGYFSMQTLVQYDYELAIGDQPISETEWQELVNLKTPLVQFRGQWIELDPQKMADMLNFWKTHQAENPEMSLLDFMQLTANADEEIDVDCDRDSFLGEMMARLQDKSRIEAIADPANFSGTLREYQQRGVAWLQYLEQLGLNGCLADDMGLGKTIQVIARLVQERELAAAVDQRVGPTLLIAPTSVVTNWQREIAKFAPQLQTVLHHGSDRPKTTAEFQAHCAACDLLITSYSLARKDVKLLSSLSWHRIVIDEAQNIKNPKANQTKAVLKLAAQSRLALTGTPIENRLMDLWSIFNFLNPGYLGTQAQFRRNFELPIQKENNPLQSNILKKLVEPFILRRVKTDQDIIKDLPDKVEQKLFCNLTPEQASLYAAVVKDVETQLEDVEGIQRKGLILSTLLRLKQICNHPRQFLQDESPFTPERSHKLERLMEIIEEIIAEGESLLIFSQFREITEALNQYLRGHCHYNTYLLHGGTTVKKREQMIAAFQDPDTEPSIFILSIKAGGVGITLTKANHVFHFDRWWNPAVEDQATDRAFRIGQKRNVFVHKFVTVGTLEERIDQMIEDKKKLAGSIIGSDESWLTELDNDAFRQLIALNKNAIL